MWSLVKSLLGIKKKHTLLHGVRRHGSTHRIWLPCHTQPHPTVESFSFVIDRTPKGRHVSRGKINATLRYRETRQYVQWWCRSRRQEFAINYQLILFQPEGPEAHPLAIALTKEPPLDITDLLAQDVRALIGDRKVEYTITVTPTELNTYPFEDSHDR